ncbi:hypothetical protein [Gaoshiqia sediminis]|uniref:Apea-like HEPN domain-containing protein n=1 Tax=Gaoshiqia sediminis TaxID=2986998 RepID=A0AA42C9P5_9BACT|nr:hypothetical protein [Gaoshiqia sediminis]MCW0482732.1 hypothetical protein [Gaoshiqia sediminis]
MNNATKYFVSRCNELLNQKTFDSYRVSLHNPVSIFRELENTIKKFHNKQVKKYNPTITAIVGEAIQIAENECIGGVLELSNYKKHQVISILSASAKDEKRIKSLSLLSRSLIRANNDFKFNLFREIESLLIANESVDIKKINCLSSWLMSELIYTGYSRSFIKSRISKFSDSLNSGNALQPAFVKFRCTLNHGPETYRVIFKIKLSQKDAFRVNSGSLSVLDEFPGQFRENDRIKKSFRSLKADELYISISIDAFDFKEAVKDSYQRISEIIDINILHQSVNTIVFEKQAFAYHLSSRRFRMEPLEELLDGFYTYQEQEFERFAQNYTTVTEGTSSREKLRSAIRFYKLGNESAELEHKILNYWIGFEQLYSSEYTDEDSINRIKNFFIALNSSFYIQRRANYLIDTLNRFAITLEGKSIEKSHLFSHATMEVIKSASVDDPLAFHRLEKYIELFYGKKTIQKSLERHSTRLEQHLTRIYRIRNEVVHEGRASANLELVAGHLRHYLLFSIEQITHALAENPVLENLDDVFVCFENLFEQVKTAENIQQVFNICDYKGYME